MGEIADMMRDGTLCQECGAVFHDMTPEGGLNESPGHPRSCRSCKREARKEKYKRRGRPSDGPSA